MCSSLLVQGGPTSVWSDEEWDAELAEARRAAERSPWGRFVHLFGDEDWAEPGPETDEALLARMADAEALTTQLVARQARDLLELRRRRLSAQLAETPDDHDPGRCTRACCDEDGWVRLEVAQALGLSERQVGARIDTARRLSRYAHAHGAVADGLLQSWTATKLLEHLDTLAPLVTSGRLERIEAATVAWLCGRPRTVAQLNARMRRLVQQARAQSGVDEKELSSRDRAVRLVPADADGLATLVARLPEKDALAIGSVLAALGRDPVGPQDSRTQQQRRCDLVTSLVTGVRAACGHHGDLELLVRPGGTPDVRVCVTIAADTLTGGSAPALVPGYGSIPASMGRDVAGAATECRPLVYHPETGRLIGLGTLSGRISWLAEVPPVRGYQHPRPMDEAIRSRDVTCRAPGCTRRADGCDCDHVVPYPRGQTSVSNGCCLCRRHHRLKTHAPGWTVLTTQDGLLTWTTPAGRRLVTSPHDYSTTDEPDSCAVDTPPF